MFHSRCGERVKLSNDNRTASRSILEFNYGVVVSSEPLVDDELFEIRIDKKIYSWSGSIEIGVTACNPETINFPPTATDLHNDTWILSGDSVLKDGRSILESYAVDLENIVEGDKLGVMRTSEGELVFHVNGRSYGVAAENIPSTVYAVVDLYGKVTQVTVISARDRLEETDEESILPPVVNDLVTNLDVQMNVRSGSLEPVERLRFHSRTGSLVKLSCNGRTAERLRPLDEFNNGVVMTHRPLQDDQLFETATKAYEFNPFLRILVTWSDYIQWLQFFADCSASVIAAHIRIDRLVEKWSGSIEVGVTTHSPNALDFPATMTNMRSGTTMMSGCGILTNGKGTRREYGEFNLDELRVGDRIGMMRKSNGNLHYFINGLDQGIAATRVPAVIWGVVDLYGMTVKVTIVDRDEREEQNLITRRNTALREHTLNDVPEEDAIDRLMFHTKCGTHAAVINNCRTAHRPNAMDDFNNGVVLTHRPLKPNELFEVRLDMMVTKWAGSIEIGVTTHSPTELEFPSTMTNIRSGTWMMTGNGIMHNGTTVIDEYGQNLDRLQVGDRVGVVLRESGALHFLVNGVDQGEAATNIPPRVFGVIDLYGQAAQATIVDYNCLCCLNSPDTTVNSSASITTRAHQPHADLHFHHVHGRNARVSNGGRTASRPRALGEFNDAIVMSNRALREDEMFAVVIEKIVDRWSGSIEAGVTAIRPEELELPGTMTDLDHDTWMLSGSAVMRDGVTMKHGYPLDLDTVNIGAVIGMKRHTDGSLHYYLDGVDQGEACTGLPTSVYPVIDLYGQCAQVSIVSPSERPREPESNDNSYSQTLHSRAEECVAITVGPIIASAPNGQNVHPQVLHRLSTFCGKNITLESGTVAVRNKTQHNNALVFSALPLAIDELFEVSIEKWAGQWAGCIAVGITVAVPNEKTQLPSTVSGIKEDTWYVSDDEVFKNGKVIRSHYCRSLSWLRVGGRIGIKRYVDSTLHVFINGQDQGVAVHNIPKRVYAVIDLYGGSVAIKVLSTVTAPQEVALADPEEELSTAYTAPPNCDGSEELKRMEDSAEKTPLEYEIMPEYGPEDLEWFELHEVRGRNVQLSPGRLTARRVGSYNQGVIITSKELPRGQLFQVRLDAINSNWVSSLCIGVTTHSVSSCSLPVTALGLKRDSWIICSDSVFHNGVKIRARYGPNLDSIGVGRLVGVMIDHGGQLHMFIDGVDMGTAASNIQQPCRVVVDLYGRCEQVTILNPYNEVTASVAPEEECVSKRESIDLDDDGGGGDDDGGGGGDDEEREHEVAEVDFNEHEKADLETHEKGTLTLVLETEPARSKLDKTNENIQSSSAGHLTSGEITPLSDIELDPKSITSNENLTLQQFEQQQNAEISRHISEANCDHKTGINLANTSLVKSPSVAPPGKPLMLRSLENSINSLTSNIPTPLISPAASAPLLVKGNMDCEYFNACLRLKASLGLPGGFFSRELPAICYCSSCCSQSGQLSKGDPPALYSVPCDWCRLPLRRRQRANSSEMEQWHVAFVGTSLGSVRRILDLGELLIPGELGLGHNMHRKLKSKQDHCDATQFVLSPTIKYAACSAFSTKHQFVDPKTKKRMVAYSAFQVLVRPGSYKVGPPSVSIVSKPVDPHLDHDSTEWVTKERNATVLTALLLKLEHA